MGAHVLTVTIRLLRHLGVCHRNLVHLGSGRVNIGQGRAAVGLVRRVRVGGQRTALVRAVKLGTHVRTASRLIGGLSETGVRGVGHLLSLVAGLGVSATATALVA